MQPHGSVEIQRVLLTIDLTEAVLREAVALSAQAIVAYHPPIFAGLKRLVPEDRTAKLVIGLLHHNIAVYTPHTALDAVPGGMNDWLCEAFGEGNREPVLPSACTPELAARFNAVASSGAPGMGRRVVLRQPLTLDEAIYRVKQHLGLSALRIAASVEHQNGTEIQTVAVCAGAGGSVFEGCNADLFLTGEMRHHDVLAASQSGTSVILTEHTNSERGYLPRLASRISGLFPDIDVVVSACDRDPLRIV